MTSLTTLRCFAAACLAIGLAASITGFRSRRAATAELAAYSEQQRLLDAEIKAAERRVPMNYHAPERVESKLNKSRPARSARKGDMPPKEVAALLATHPQLLDLFLNYSRARAHQRFMVFYQMAGLSAEQSARFDELDARHQEESIDLAATAAAQNLPMNDPAIAAVSQQQADRLRNDEIRVLGDAGYQQLQQFNRAQGALDLFDGAAYLALAPGDAFTATQAGQLMRIVAAASPGYEKGGAFDPMAVDWTTVLSQAAPILSPVQLDALKAQARAFGILTRMQAYMVKLLESRSNADSR